MSYAGSGSQFVNTMPFFTVKKSEDYASWLVVTCTRCERYHLVQQSWWYRSKEANKIGTRPCPYCFRASRLPKQRDIIR